MQLDSRSNQRRGRCLNTPTLTSAPPPPPPRRRCHNPSSAHQRLITFTNCDHSRRPRSRFFFSNRCLSCSTTTRRCHRRPCTTSCHHDEMSNHIQRNTHTNEAPPSLITVTTLCWLFSEPAWLGGVSLSCPSSLPLHCSDEGMSTCSETPKHTMEQSTLHG